MSTSIDVGDLAGARTIYICTSCPQPLQIFAIKNWNKDNQPQETTMIKFQ